MDWNTQIREVYSSPTENVQNSHDSMEISIKIDKRYFQDAGNMQKSAYSKEIEAGVKE